MTDAAERDNGRGGDAARALVPLVAQGPQRPSGAAVDVPLIAQLLAHRLDLPQSRVRRRAAPQPGAAAYAEMRGRLVALSGHFSRTI